MDVNMITKIRSYITPFARKRIFLKILAIDVSEYCS